MGASWPRVPLGEVARLVWRGEIPEPGRSYRLVGVSLWGRGASVRETIDGTGTNYPQLFRIEEGDILVNKIWARNGSLSVAGAELAGAYGSPEFPTYSPNREYLDPRWAYWFTRHADCWRQCDELSRGTSGQNRLRPERFLEVRIPLPPLPEQRRIVAQLDAAAERVEAHRRAAVVIGDELDATLASAFQRITAGAPRARMGDVAPLVRREVAIDLDASYTEIGVKSFYKGIFHRRTMKGEEFTWQSLYRIFKGDIVFSNLMAWEQAIGTAHQCDHLCVGNHRMLTCEPDLTRSTTYFIEYFFRTAEGFASIVDASPGSIARNKTLSPALLAKIELPLPSLDAQRWFDAVVECASAVRKRVNAAEVDLAALLPALLHLSFDDEPEVLPLERIAIAAE